MANLGDMISLPQAAASGGYAAPIFAGGYPSGGGLGGDGILTGLLLGSLVGNGGFGRGDHGHAHVPVCPPAPQIIPVPFPDRDCATTDDLNALQASVNTGNILTGIADIKAAVPLAEAQVQLALAGAVSGITANNNASTALLNNGITNGFTSVLLNANQNANALQRDICNVDTNVDRTGTMLLSAITADGERTRSLIVANQIAELNRIAAERQDEIIELRYNNRADRDRHGVEVTMINNQSQNQLQFQAQAQVLNTLHHGIVDALQSIKATNQAINIGAGTQVANPTNTNSNVRA